MWNLVGYLIHCAIEIVVSINCYYAKDFLLFTVTQVVASSTSTVNIIAPKHLHHLADFFDSNQINCCWLHPLNPPWRPQLTFAICCCACSFPRTHFRFDPPYFRASRPCEVLAGSQSQSAKHPPVSPPLPLSAPLSPPSLFSLMVPPSPHGLLHNSPMVACATF